MLKNKENIFYTYLFCSLFSLAGEDQITDHGRWAIYSPHEDTSNVSKKQIRTQSSYEYLKELGETAHKYWQKDTEPRDVTKNLNKIFAPVDRSFLIGLIDEILASDILLEEITKASYKNITGFIKLVLTSGGKDSWKLRLHIWEQKEKEYPHNHKWDFFSKIMTGYLTQNIFEQQGSATDLSNEYCICEPVSLMPLLADGQKACPCRDHYILTEKESGQQHTFLTSKNQSVLGAGESYFMTNDLIHTINPGKHAVTFVFTSAHVSENSEVFVPTELINDITKLQKYAPSITKEELIQELLFVKKVLSQLCLSNKYLPELIHFNHGYFNRNSNMHHLANWREKILQIEPSSHVLQLTEKEKNEWLISADAQGNMIIGQKNPQENIDYLFVLLDNVMYASPKNFSHEAAKLICHTSFTDYAPVDAAGLLKFDEFGTLRKIEAYSGHYEPSIEHMVAAYNYLESIGVNMQQVKISNYQDRI